jgi:hypothetical protein
VPLQRCEDGGRPGWRWGQAGKCYTYAPGSAAAQRLAKQRAMAQAVAMSHQQQAAGKKPELPLGR